MTLLWKDIEISEPKQADEHRYMFTIAGIRDDGGQFVTPVYGYLDGITIENVRSFCHEIDAALKWLHNEGAKR